MIVFAGVAQAESPNTHVLTIHLPGGGVEQIRYSGDAPPEIYFRPTPALIEPSLLFPAFGPGSPFAVFDRISEEMELRAARLLREAAAMDERLPRGPDGLIEASTRALPPGGHSYTFVSTVSDSGICARSVEITFSRDGKPRVASRSYGQCGAHATKPRSVSTPLKPRHRPETITVDAQSSPPAKAPRSGLVQEASWRQ
jgi:hypothetical protein